MEQENKIKEADKPAEASATSLASEQTNEEAARKSQSSEMNNRRAENPGEGPVKAESSKKRTPKSLKAKSKIKKGSLGGISLKTEKTKDNQQFWGRNRKKKNKSAIKEKEEDNKNESANNKNQSSREDKRQKNSALEEHSGKGQGTQKNQENIAGCSRSQRNQKSEDKHGGQDKSSRNPKNKGKLDLKEKSQGDQKKKEKLGGLIFMCNSRTKPDCFRYQVMGMTSSKKDLVLGVKPGLKLFLYDFDFRLMYGIYQASSSGGMRLEPKAFGGSFPVQVRFSVHKDCVPLPESVFKKAIKDNYDASNKFDIELTIPQVRKLSELFRPVAFQSVKLAAVPVHSVPVTTIREREVYDRLRESRPHSDRETFVRVNGDSRRYPVRSHERDQHIEHREVVPIHREEAPHDLYMSEKEYRTYGLQRERRNLTPSHIAASALDRYPRNLEKEHLLRQPAPPHSDTVPVLRESVLADPLYSTQREFCTYNIGGRSELLNAAPSVSAVSSSSAVAALDSYRRDPFNSYQFGTSSASVYSLPPRREEVSLGSYYIDGRRKTYLSEADPLHRRETDPVNKLYLKYGVEPLSDYKQVHEEAKRETVPPPVSSRYSFAGPSVSYR
ncbi:uncharacterized protein LOC8280234 [Ricinus communis]|uniref:uncharacterized protein LOC8280234 n=1 Tax=Ricinus communis TaxID=3988 RepID=UPI00201A9780|nr:uncharacterized protein LOC8280234 [Ricinus communis]